jgi:hypothetical protein
LRAWNCGPAGVEVAIVPENAGMSRESDFPSRMNGGEHEKARSPDRERACDGSFEKAPRDATPQEPAESGSDDARLQAPDEGGMSPHPGGYMPPRHPLVPPDELARRTDLNWNAKIVWTVIWAHIGDDGFCTRRVADLAERIGLPERTFFDALEELIDLGLLAAVKRPGRTTAYTVRDPCEIRRGTPAKSAGVEADSPLRNPQGSDWESEENRDLSEGTPAKSAVQRAPALSKNSSTTTYPNSKNLQGDSRERASPTRLTAPLVPSLSTRRAAQKEAREGVDLDFVLEKFNAHFGPGGGGQDETDTDWPRRWRAWVKKERAPAVAAAAPGGARAVGVAGQLSQTSRRLKQLADGGA